MTDLTASEANDAVQQVLKKAATDADFHALALKDPKAAVREATGKEVPANYNVRFVSNEGADLTLVLPDVVADSEELSDAELEQVAGGRCGGSCGGSCVLQSM